MKQFFPKAATAVSSLAFFFILHTSTAQQPVIALTPVISSGLSSPIQVVNAGDGTNRVFIVQKGGTIRVYNQSFGFLATFLTVSNVSTDGERGLLSIAFHPSYTSNGFFYVYYTNGNGDLELARYKVSANANVADAASKVIVLTIPHPSQSNHNGGELHFGTDGYLYLSTGDGGGGGDPNNNAQNTSVQLGKILRLAVNTSSSAPYYTTASGNPFGNNIYVLGLRNPFRWSFDRQTGDMWIGDVGQNSQEEIDHRAAGSIAGANFGWRCYEGDNTYNTSGCATMSNYIFPVYSYPTQDPSAAVTGGTVYRGTDADLQGWYVAADFYSGRFYIIKPNGSGGWTTIVQNTVQTGIADFGETENGELYAASLTGNAVYQVLATNGGPLPVTLSAFTAAVNQNGQAQLKWETSFEQNISAFEIEYSTNGSNFIKAGLVAAQNAPTGADYIFSHAVAYRGTVYYRLKMIDKDGNFRYSSIVRLNFTGNLKSFVSPSVITNNTLNVIIDGSYNSLEFVTINGEILMQRKIMGVTGNINMRIPVVPDGVYLVRLSGNSKTAVQKVLVQ
jgi:glucose/arabinose dehydrogenase